MKGQDWADCWALGLPQVICRLGGAGFYGVTRWSRPIWLGQCIFRIGYVGRGFNTGKMVPIGGLHQREAWQRNNSDCPSSTHPMQHNSVFLCMPLVHPELLTCWSPGWVSASKSVCGLFKGNVWVFRFFPSHWWPELPLIFSHILWELLFLRLDVWAREPLMELRLLVLSGGPL